MATSRVEKTRRRPSRPEQFVQRHVPKPGCTSNLIRFSGAWSLIIMLSRVPIDASGGAPHRMIRRQSARGAKTPVQGLIAVRLACN